MNGTKTRLELDLSLGVDWPGQPEAEDFAHWARAVLPPGEWVLSIRLVDEAEGRQLNARYRGRDRATNVLSFPAELPPGVDVPLLGDLVLCSPVVAREAEHMGKPVQHHWAHLTIHGVLHLLGYDHQHDAEAQEMERVEVEALARLGLPDPYAPPSE